MTQHHLFITFYYYVGISIDLSAFSSILLPLEAAVLLVNFMHALLEQVVKCPSTTPVAIVASSLVTAASLGSGWYGHSTVPTAGFDWATIEKGEGIREKGERRKQHRAMQNIVRDAFILITGDGDRRRFSISHWRQSGIRREAGGWGWRVIPRHWSKRV